MNRAQSERGVALAVVVWFLAAMSLLVAGIVYQARVDVHMAQAHLARARVEAAGDGATQLVLAAFTSGELPWRDQAQAVATEVRVGEQLVQVELVPLDGLININGAPEPLLAELFAGPGGRERGEAQQLAASVVQWRTTGPARRAPGMGMQRFDTVEDLLKVDGVGRTLLDNIRDFIAAPAAGGGALDWMSAPTSLLESFREHHPQQVAAALKRRERLADLTAAPRRREGQAPQAAGNFRVDAVVIYGDRPWLRRSWVSMGGGGSSPLPWQITRVEPPRVKINS